MGADSYLDELEQKDEVYYVNGVYSSYRCRTPAEGFVCWIEISKMSGRDAAIKHAALTMKRAAEHDLNNLKGLGKLILGSSVRSNIRRYEREFERIKGEGPVAVCVPKKFKVGGVLTWEDIEGGYLYQPIRIKIM